MTKYYYYILLLIVGTQYSCVSDANFEIDGAESRIFFYSEFEPNQDIAFKYSTAIGLSDLTPEINPTLTTEFNLELREGNVLLDPSFRYNPVTGLFVSPHNAQEINTGTFYTITTNLKGHSDIKKVTATTFIPEPKDFIALEDIEDRSYQESNDYIIDKDIKISTDESHRYFEVEAYVIDPNDDTSFKKISIQPIHSVKGVLPLPERKSILIESKELNSQFAFLNLQATIDVNLLDINEGVYLKLKTVTEDHYRYHFTLAKEIESTYAPLSEPVVNYTNIDDGIGLFSGFSSTVHTLPFKE